MDDNTHLVFSPSHVYRGRQPGSVDRRSIAMPLVAADLIDFPDSRGKSLDHGALDPANPPSVARDGGLLDPASGLVDVAIEDPGLTQSIDAGTNTGAVHHHRGREDGGSDRAGPALRIFPLQPGVLDLGGA